MLTEPVFPENQCEAVCGSESGFANENDIILCHRLNFERLNCGISSILMDKGYSVCLYRTFRKLGKN